MNIIFFGTTEVSVPFLRQLVDTPEHKVVAVITQPDRPARRGHHIQMPAVKILANERKIPVFQPETFDENLIKELQNLKPDVSVVVSYGKLIPPQIFQIPFYGCFNVHFALLPKYRGAAPVQWALIKGEKESGVTTFWIEKGLDTGPILVQKSLAILPEDDYISLLDKMIPLGVSAMNETLERIKSGNCTGIPQSGEPSLAPTLKKDDGKINWLMPAQEIVNLIRGTKPWPGAYTIIGVGKAKATRLKILTATTSSEIPEPSAKGAVAGQIAAIIKNRGFAVKCLVDFLVVEKVQPENKSPMSAWDFLQGSQIKPGDKFE